ncbi:unnamed protein product, partial [Nesidiocoris tenuis]
MAIKTYLVSNLVDGTAITRHRSIVKKIDDLYDCATKTRGKQRLSCMDVMRGIPALSINRFLIYSSYCRNKNSFFG